VQYFLCSLNCVNIYNRLILISKCNTSHTILDSQNVIVDCVDPSDVRTPTTTGGLEGQLGVIDTRKVEGTGGLRLVHVQAQGPRVQGGRIERRRGQIGCVHLGNHVMVESTGHVLEEGVTVDVHGGGVERVQVGPRGTVDSGRHEVDSFDGVVKVREVDVHVSVIHGLILDLCDEKFVFSLDEVAAFLCVEVHVGPVHLGGRVGCEARAALDSNLDGVVLETDEG